MSRSAADDGCSPSDHQIIRALSSHALAALQEFYADRDAHEERFERLKEAAERNDAGQTEPLSMQVFAEDWNKSQFWVGDSAGLVPNSM